MQMVNHQCDCLSLFLDPAPCHQLSKGLASAGQAMQPDFLFAAAFSDRSALLLAMAYLFNSAGRRVQPGLSSALVRPIDGSSHAATFTWCQAPAAWKSFAACASSSVTSAGTAIQADATRWFWLHFRRSSR